MVLHTGLCYYVVVSVDIPSMWHTFFIVFSMSAFIFTIH